MTAAREWTPYGVEVDGTQPGLGYAGEWFDAHVGAQYLHARWYDVATGRFTSRDPMQADLTSYIYATSNPINYVDPTGYFSEKTIKDSLFWRGGYGNGGN